MVSKQVYYENHSSSAGFQYDCCWRLVWATVEKHVSTHLMVTWEVPELYPLPEHDRLIPPMVAETPALIDWPQYSWTQSWFISSWGWRNLQQSFLIFLEPGLGCLSKKRFSIILKDPQISLNVLLFIHLIVFICFFLVFFLPEWEASWNMQQAMQ